MEEAANAGIEMELLPKWVNPIVDSAEAVNNCLVLTRPAVVADCNGTTAGISFDR